MLRAGRKIAPGLLFSALVGAIAHGDDLYLHLVHAPLVEADGACHGGADINDAAAVEGAAVVHAHQAALAGGDAGDAHGAGQGQGAVRGVFGSAAQAFTQSADAVGSFVERGLTHFAVLQRFLYTHGAVAAAVHCVWILLQLRFRACVPRRCCGTVLFAPAAAGPRQQDAGCQKNKKNARMPSHALILADMVELGNSSCACGVSFARAEA